MTGQLNGLPVAMASIWTSIKHNADTLHIPFLIAQLNTKNHVNMSTYDINVVKTAYMNLADLLSEKLVPKVLEKSSSSP